MYLSNVKRRMYNMRCELIFFYFMFHPQCQDYAHCVESAIKHMTACLEIGLGAWSVAFVKVQMVMRMLALMSYLKARIASYIFHHIILVLVISFHI